MNDVLAEIRQLAVQLVCNICMSSVSISFLHIVGAYWLIVKTGQVFSCKTNGLFLHIYIYLYWVLAMRLVGKSLSEITCIWQVERKTNLHIYICMYYSYIILWHFAVCHNLYLHRRVKQFYKYSAIFLLLLLGLWFWFLTAYNLIMVLPRLIIISLLCMWAA